MNYRVEKNKVLVSLAKGDEILDCLYTVIKEANIKFGWINGIGAAENIVLGAYPSKIKKYIKKTFKGEFELTNVMGNITTKNKESFVHIHANISDEECNAFGGHLFSATIAVTGEFIIFLSDCIVNRTESSDIGLYLWDLNENN